MSIYYILIINLYNSNYDSCFVQLAHRNPENFTADMSQLQHNTNKICLFCETNALSMELFCMSSFVSFPQVMCLRFMRIVCISSSLSFIVKWYSILWIENNFFSHLHYFQVWLLLIKLDHLCRLILLFLPDKILDMCLLGHRVRVCLAL